MSRASDRRQKEQVLNQSTYYHILIWIILFNFGVQVGSGELLKFQAHYGSLLKASMLTLHKRDKKQEKLRSEEAAKRKKKMTETIILDGPKRGKGRRAHQRKVKALLKQEESQKKYREREEARKKSEATVVIGVTLQASILPFEPVLILLSLTARCINMIFVIRSIIQGLLNQTSIACALQMCHLKLQGRGQDIVHHLVVLHQLS